MDKSQQVQNLFKMAAQITKTKEQQDTTLKEKIDVVEIQEVSNNLPTTYMGTQALSLSSKDVLLETGFLEKLEIDHSRYSHLSFTEEEAKKINKGMNKMSAGTASVVPLRCTGPNCAFKATCLAEDTEVLVANTLSGTKKIQDILPHDIVYSFNLETGEIEKDIAVKLTHMGTKLVYSITTGIGQSIRATADHPFLTLRNGELVWLSLEDGLTTEDYLFIGDSSMDIESLPMSEGDLFADMILSIEEDGESVVYDIEVQNNHNFIANGIVVHNCHYQQVNKAPIGEACLLETELVHYWMSQYIAEYKADDRSPTDMRMISRLCELDIYDMRATKYIAEKEQDLLTDFVSSFDESGAAISNKAVSAAWEVKERIDRMRGKILKDLIATRDAKAKTISSMQSVANENSLSSLKDKLDELIRNKKLADAKIIDV